MSCTVLAFEKWTSEAITHKTLSATLPQKPKKGKVFCRNLLIQGTVCNEVADGVRRVRIPYTVLSSAERIHHGLNPKISNVYTKSSAPLEYSSMEERWSYKPLMEVQFSLFQYYPFGQAVRHSTLTAAFIGSNPIRDVDSCHVDESQCMQWLMSFTF